MTKPQGPIRGFIGRWVMRFEAAGQMLGLAFQGTTAVSALSGVLTYAGYSSYVPYVLGIAGVAIAAFAFGYVEFGIYNRKNRENQERGNNFGKPQNIIDNIIMSRGFEAGDKGRTLDDDERNAIREEVFAAYREFRDGVRLNE